MSGEPAAKDPEIVQLTEAQVKARRARSIAMAFALVAFVIVFYVATVVKFGPDVLNRPL